MGHSVLVIFEAKFETDSGEYIDHFLIPENTDTWKVALEAAKEMEKTDGWLLTSLTYIDLGRVLQGSQ